MENETTPVENIQNNAWGLESLLKKAFERTKDRFLSYLVVLLISIGIGLAFFIAILLLIGLFALLYFLTKAIPVLIILGLVAFLALIILSYYVGAWIQLATAQVIISPEKLTAGEAMKKVRPLIWKFIILEVLMSLFFIGLVPLGVLSLFIILILWGFWSTFTVFVFLEQQKEGLANVWISRSMINQRFWGVAGRESVVWIAVWILSFAVSSASYKSSLAGLLSLLISLFTGPFIISYSYEIYKNLTPPKETTKPNIWIILSILGWILGFIGIILGSFAMVKFFETLITNPDFFNNLPNNFNKFPIPTPKYYIPPPNSI